MRMKKTRSELLKHINERLKLAWTHDSDSHNHNADMFFDAIAIAGFELDFYDRAYWAPYSKEIDELIEIARRACLEYENDPTDEREAWSRMFAAEDYLESRIGTLAAMYEAEAAANQTDREAELTPVAQLNHRRFSSYVPDENQTAELQMERDIRRHQTLTHILVMQQQMNNALNELERQLTPFLPGGE